MTGVRELGLPQGNALALPRATTGADAVSEGPQILQRTGSVVLADGTGYNNAGLAYGGRILGDTSGIAVFRNTIQNSAGNTFYKICGVNYSDSGVTSALTPYSFGTASGVWQTFGYNNSWSAGDSAYFTNAFLSDIYRVYVSGSSVVATLVKSSAVPNSGTFTVGGQTFSTYNPGTGYIIGEALDNQPDVKKLSNGDVLLTRPVLIGSQVWLAGFVIDTAFNLVRSFPIIVMSGASTSTAKSHFVLPVKNSTDVFSLFGMATSNTASGRVFSATFSAVTGAVSATTTDNVNFGTTIWGNSTPEVGEGFVRVGYNVYNIAYKEITFKVNSDLSVINGAVNVSLDRSWLSAPIQMPQLSYYDPTYSDMVYISGLGSSTTFYDRVGVFGTGTLPEDGSGARGVTSEIAVLNYSSADATAVVGVPYLKTVYVLENDPSVSAANSGHGPNPQVRVGEKAFIAGYKDQASNTLHRINAQLLKVV